jgi:trimeric autotransporter adhesin
MPGACAARSEPRQFGLMRPTRFLVLLVSSLLLLERFIVCATPIAVSTAELSAASLLHTLEADLPAWPLTTAAVSILSGQGSVSTTTQQIGAPIGGGQGSWDDRFNFPGIEGQIYAMATNGTGTEIYVGGSFTSAGGVPVKNIALWNGQAWSPLGSGVEGTVYSLAFNGTELLVGGEITSAGGEAVQNLAVWNPTTRIWAPFAGGGINGPVRTILIVSATETYFGGSFDRALGTNANNIVQWDGSAGLALGDGTDAQVNVLVYDSATTNLYVGGEFTNADGRSAKYAAKYSAGTWSALGNGLDGSVNAIAVVSTNQVYFGGAFQNAGGFPAQSIARWDGQFWAPLESASRNLSFQSVNALVAIGNELFVGGSFTASGGGSVNNIARWDGANWLALGSGVDGPVSVFALSGTSLYVGGNFTRAGGLISKGFAKWNLSGSFLPFGQGLNGYINAIAVSANGDIYVGGDFTTIGSTNALRIARWNGANWSALGSGVSGTVLSLAVSGGDLYVGGSFTNAGGIEVSNIARWDGFGWSALGAGVNGSVNAIAVDGDAIYVGGTFNRADGVSLSNIARWNGQTWSDVGGGVSGGAVHALAVRGSQVFAAGAFNVAGNSMVNRIARWDGIRWNPLTAGINGTVTALTFSDSGELYVGGQFNEAGGITGANNVARWDGNRWNVLGSGLNGPVRALAWVDQELLVAGSFTVAGQTLAKNLAKWNADVQNWTFWLSNAESGVEGNVFTIAFSQQEIFIGGIFSAETITNLARLPRSGWVVLGLGLDGPALAMAVEREQIYVGGGFTNAGAVRANYIARWDGSTWSALGNGVNGPVHAVAVNAGHDVFVGGTFTLAGGVSANRIARWDGSRWSPLGIGLDGPVRAIAVSGSNLYVGGEFTRAGGFSANRIARWDGTRWSALDTGMDGNVLALAVDSQGALYAGGEFTKAGKTNAVRVAKWDGTKWLPLGKGANNGVNDSVLTLATVGEDLFVGGRFTVAGTNTAAAYLAQWDGQTWLALGGGVSGTNNSVRTMAPGEGRTVYLGGEFTDAAGLMVNRIARWDSVAWSALGLGVDGPISALVVKGRQVYVGGEFNHAARRPSLFFGRWSFENVLPFVSFLSPRIGQTFIAPASVPVIADAFDVDGSISRVDFYVNAVLIGSATNAPYQVQWTNDAPGIYTLTTRAIDNDGGSISSSAFVTVVKSNQPPAISIFMPADNSVFTAPVSVTVFASANDLDGRIALVEFFANGQSIGSVNAAPFNVIWSNAPVGTHVLTARTTDELGATANASPVTITVAPPVLPRLSGLTRNPDGTFGFQLTTVEGHRLVIETSTDLLNWEALSTNTPVNGVIDFVDPGSSNAPYRFYRAVDQP